ncbi:MAG: hypothetical protein IJD91_07230 [Clostridia bacterium]|nr:hypothetical protein [Clostridia bacterium]
MNSKVKKLILITTLLSITFFSITTAAAPDDIRILSAPIWMPDDALLDNENTPIAIDDTMKSEKEMFFTEAVSAKRVKFTNLVDGYSIVIPSSLNIDMSLSDVGAIFSDDTITLKIFKESFDTASERLSYLNYSNRFLDNTSDHKLIKKESFIQGTTEYFITEWSRKRLSKVKDDRNYYACVDVCIDARVYTFFLNSNIPFNLYGGYMDIVNSLTTFDPTVPHINAYNAGYKGTSTSRLNSSAKRTYYNLFDSDASFKMGMFPPDKFGGFARMEEIEEQLDYKFCAFLVYTEIADISTSSPDHYASRVKDYLKKVERNFTYAQSTERAIELTLQTPLSRGESPSNMMYEILDGKYDYFINEYASLISKYSDVTVLFRPFNEMNGDWCNYSSFHTSRDPKVYVDVYRYLHEKFDEAGCNNTLWVWNPNEISFPNYKWNNQSLYYPGDKYVDIYGITGYNTGTYYEGESWRSFDEIYAPIYEKVLQLNEKPVMITEFSCSAIGGDKVAWIEDMFLSLPKYDKIKLGIWWHATDYDGENLSRPYFIDTPEGTLDVFDKYLN